VRLFLVVKRQPIIYHHVTRIRPSIFIGKERQTPLCVHFHHPVKLIINLICGLINCMLSRDVVGGLHNPHYQGPSPPISQFAWAASSRKSLGGSKHLPFKNDWGHCVLGDLQCCRNVVLHFPRSVPRHKPVSELYGQLLWTHGLVLFWHALSTVGPYIDSSVPFQIMSNQLNLPPIKL
jgi:hypothetical protein